MFGVAPAFRGTRLNLASTLKDETRGLAVRRSRLANTLVVGQMALCLVLLLAATLCLRSLVNARAFNPGFAVKDRVAADFNLNHFGYTPDQAKDFYTRLIARVQALPGVGSAALASHLPLGTQRSNGNFQLEGQEVPPGEQGFFFEQFSVGPGYFATMGTALLQGREFTEVDREGAPRVAIINEAAARRYWPGQNPIGRRLFAGGPGPGNALEIVGVVPTGRYRTLGEEPKPVFYGCFLQGQHLGGTLIAHVQGAPGPALTAIRSATQELDSRLTLTRLTTLEQHLSLALFPVRTSGLLLGVLGIVALVLAVSGLFGVIAYSVSQRTREVGIRMALGAQQRDVLRLVLRQGLKLAGIGVGLGLLGALAATQLLRSLLFGINPTDPATFLVIPLLLLAVAWVACWLPARRAARVDPMEALRTE
jgi:predicted permease